MNEKVLAREPTEAMIEAAAASKGWGPDEFDGAVIHPAIIWQAMFDAAPDRTPAGEAVRCYHEAYQGSCAHCGVAIVNGRAFTRPQASLTAEEDDLAWLARHPALELSFQGWDEDGGNWCVHRVGGSPNDREWTLLANAETPAEALSKARARQAPSDRSVS
jgi:hypothetical protein